MKTESVVQSPPFTGRKQSLIEDARRDREKDRDRDKTGDREILVSSPGPSHSEDLSLVFEEKTGRSVLHLVLVLKSGKNSGFFKAAKVFQVSQYIFNTINNVKYFHRTRLPEEVKKKKHNTFIKCYSIVQAIYFNY